MRFIKRLFLLFFLLFFLFVLLCIGCVYYAFKIEPYRININNIDLNEKTTNDFGIKIVQISDLHIKEDYTYKELSKVVEKINSQNPDVVIFSGDLYDNYALYNDNENIINELSKIDAKYAKIAVWGNRDYGGGASRIYEDVMSESGFELLCNENKVVELENEKKVLFTGLDDYLLGSPEIPNTYNFEDFDYKVLVMHEPDPMEQYIDYDYNLLLSGHSHGGQVEVPFFESVNDSILDLTSCSSTYSKGMYILDENSGKKLYVNSGLGTTHISARFLVVPEITVFNLYF